MMPTATERFHELLAECIRADASDLHLTGGEVPFLRRHGQLAPLNGQPLSEREVEEMADALMNPRQREVFETSLALDLAYSPDPQTRYRINVFRERGRVAIAIRRLDQELHSPEFWHLPPQLVEFADLKDGLVLVTGPTGSGKTTTLATLLHRINASRSCHVITIEDPVEFMHRNERSLIHQRELHTDVTNYADAIRSALREDPDVILVGEMRDPETIRAAVTAAETGHLVFSTLHTGDAVGAVDRMIGVFSAEEQTSLRQQLSMVLRAVVAQRLLPSRTGEGRYPAVEILKVTNAVSHLIRTGKPQQIYSAMEGGSTDGMQTMEQALAELVVHGRVEERHAAGLARLPAVFEQRLRFARQGRTSSSSQRRSRDGRFTR